MRSNRRNIKKIMIPAISAVAVVGATTAITATILATKDNNKNIVNDNEMIKNNGIVGESVQTPVVDLTPSQPSKNEGSTGGSIIVGGGSSSNNNIGSSTGNNKGSEIALLNMPTSISLEKDEVTGKYTLSIEQRETTAKFGELVFVVNGVEQESKTLLVNPGDTVTVKAKINDRFTNTYTLTQLNVYSKGQSNITLGTTKVEENTYSFTMPSETDEMGMLNPFYKGTEIVVESVYGVMQINDWKFDFNKKAYTYQLKAEDVNYKGDRKEGGVFITDDGKYPKGIESKINLDLEFHGVEGEAPEIGEGLFILENSSFILDANGFDVYFSGFTIKRGTYLEVTNSNQVKRSKVYGSRDVAHDSIYLWGVFGQGQNVDIITVKESHTEFLILTSGWQIEHAAKEEAKK